MASIFISYRREDASGHAGRLCDRLNVRLGADRVFMDVEDVRPGQDFVQAIDETVARCDHLLVVIGPRWLDAMNRRRESDADYVCHEIRSGLRRDKTIVPVLVGGAMMPAPAELPPDVAELTRRNAVQIHDDRFDEDVERLVRALGEGTAPRRQQRSVSRRSLVAAAVLAVCAVAAWFLAFRPEPRALSGEWLAEMQKPGQQPYRVRFTLVHQGDSLAGTVRYPTGDGVLEDGGVDGDTVTFSTSHVPQFASDRAVIRYAGTIERDSIRLTSTDEAGVATGIARMVEPSQ